MGNIIKIATLAWLVALGAQALAQEETTWMDEFDPADPRAEEMLKEFDRIHEQETGMPSWIGASGFGAIASEFMRFAETGCYRETCTVFARVSKRNQKLYLAINGRVEDVWDVSTGARGHATPNFDRHPSGRIYDKYSSSTYPGGDYKGLGNMPYAVFIKGGYAIHGTPRSNWPMLGRPASHGCIRVHPDNGYRFNRLVRANGIRQTWITVEE